MDWLRQSFSTIGKQLGGLTAAHKLLAASVVVVLVLSLVIVGLLTSRREMAEVLPGAAMPDQQRAEGYLAGLGIESRYVEGRLHVRQADVARARAALAESGNLPSEKSLFFESLISSQSWTNSRQQNDQQYTIALQNELARMIAGFKGVKNARVIIDVPDRAGLGAGVKKAVAAAAVETADGRPMPQSLVDAVAALVSGSKAGLDISSVRVLDQATAKYRWATDQSSGVPDGLMENVSKFENDTRRKMMDLVSYIPGVEVVVTAQLDNTRVTSQVQTNLPEKQGTVSVMSKVTEETSSSTSSTGSRGAEPGPMSNQTMDISQSGGGGGGTRTETTTSTTEFDVRIGSRNETIFDPKGHPVSVAVSVNVPRRFVTDMLAAPAQPAAGGAAQAPSEADIKRKFDADIRPVIIASLAPHLRALMRQGNMNASPEQLAKIAEDSLSVSLIPLDTLPSVAGGAQAAGLTLGVGGGSLGLGGGIVEKVVVGALALVAMGMMLVMVRKASKKTELPSAEELVGLPPTLETQTDLIGEANEDETAMAGIEVGEQQLQSQKVLEQVTEMVQKDPAAAARLINRWANIED